jgi:hypothetical protein
MEELEILTDKIRIEDTPLTDEEQNELKKQIKEASKEDCVVTLVKTQLYIYTPIIQKELQHCRLVL